MEIKNLLGFLNLEVPIHEIFGRVSSALQPSYLYFLKGKILA